MGQLIGMDEAGFGPNLGPLVIATTTWRVPDDPAEVDLYTSLEAGVTRKADRSRRRLHIADSKAVHSAAKGIGALETSALVLLEAAGIRPRTFMELWRHLIERSGNSPPHDPWFVDADVPLPVAADEQTLSRLSESFLESLSRASVDLTAIDCAVVQPEQFNRDVARRSSKGLVLTHNSLALLRSVWDPAEAEPVLIIGDKHGGRNRYDDLLSEYVDHRFVFRLQESREISRYRVETTELRFQMRGESHLPVAAASIVAKYVRELAMELFNDFWCRHLPNLKRTKGYPVDARRYADEIAELQQQFGIPINVLWRER